MTRSVYEICLILGKNTIWDNLTWNGHTFAGGELEPAAGMVALWHTNQNWSDSTGGNDGTAYGQANFSTDAKHGSHSGNFDGNGDYALISDTGLPSGSAARTVEAWIKTRTTVASGEYRGILSYGTLSTGQYFGLAIDNHTLYYDSWGGGNRSIRGNIPVDNGSWHHIAFTYNGTVAKLYVDGNPDTEKTLTAPNTALTGTGRIAYYAWASSYHNGLIDELTVWNKTLTPEEIQQHYEGKLGTVKMQVRSCDDSLCDTEQYEGPTGAGSYYDTPGTFDLNLDSNQWFQYKAHLETNDASQTPKLHNVTVRGEIPAETPTINITSAWAVFDGQQHNMSGSGLHWSWTSPTLDKGTHTYTAHAQDAYGNTNHTETRTVTVPSYDIIFNVTSGEDGSSIPNAGITCDYAGFNKGGDTSNPYGPYEFPIGQWTCEFTAEEKYAKTQIFIANENKTVNVVMEKQLSLTVQEHDWSREVYECIVEGDCTAYRYLQSLNATVEKIWNKYLPTNPAVVTQEDTVSSTLSSTQNITLNYTLNIPYKEGYANGDLLPIRIFYWFTDGTTCYSQDKQTDANNAASPYCVPLIATYLGPNNGTVTFMVDLRPDLPAGIYQMTRQIDIDPVENGEPVWITYGRGAIGTITVLEDPALDVAEETVEVGHTVAKGISDGMNAVTGAVTGSIGSLGSVSALIALAMICLTVLGVTYIRNKK